MSNIAFSFAESAALAGCGIDVLKDVWFASAQSSIALIAARNSAFVNPVGKRLEEISLAYFPNKASLSCALSAAIGYARVKSDAAKSRVNDSPSARVIEDP